MRSSPIPEWTTDTLSGRIDLFPAPLRAAVAAGLRWLVASVSERRRDGIHVHHPCADASRDLAVPL